MLTDRDYTLILDKSGSMATRDQRGGKSRWQAARESTEALAARCDELDPDGLTVYVFAGRFRRYEGVTASRVSQVFRENEPSGGTDLAGVLRHALGDYFTRRTAGRTKPEGETFLIVTDGEPDDRSDVMRLIVEATKQLTRDDELGLSFLQIGGDPEATRFLRILDDELTRAGARHDIVDTLTFDEIEDVGLTEVLLRALHD
jgi:uncharacterized protein with von Willebrand factor type A (vWA) domain